jgi:hypothetical protein
MYPIFDVRSAQEVRDNASFTGGLSAESVDIAAGNATDLIKSLPFRRTFQDTQPFKSFQNLIPMNVIDAVGFTERLNICSLFNSELKYIPKLNLISKY